MSKEIEEKEIVEKEDNKMKGNGLLVTILVIVLLAVSFAFGYGIGGTKVVEKVITNGVEKNNDNTNDSGAFRTIDADSMVTNLWNRVNFSGMLNINNYSELNYNGQNVSEMSDKLKGKLASTYFGNTLNDYSNNRVYIKESDIQYGYDSLFGAGTYKSGQKVYGSCLDLTYDGDFVMSYGAYVSPAPACGGTSLVGFKEAIVKVEKNSNKMVITSALAFYSSETNSVYKTYKDATNKENAITEPNAVQENAFNNYVETNKESLTQYKFTFDVDSNGFYKYVGYELVK